MPACHAHSVRHAHDRLSCFERLASSGPVNSAGRRTSDKPAFYLNLDFCQRVRLPGCGRRRAGKCLACRASCSLLRVPGKLLLRVTLRRRIGAEAATCFPAARGVRLAGNSCLSGILASLPRPLPFFRMLQLDIPSAVSINARLVAPWARLSPPIFRRRCR